MSAIFNEIDGARKILYLKRINEELADLDKTSERYKMLTEIVTSYSTPKTSILNETLEKININAFQKNWNQLHNFHKLVKIKEYIKEKYNTIDQTIQKKIENLLAAAVEDGTLNSVKLVTYDKLKCIITDIPCLVINGTNVSLKLPKKHIKV